MHPSQRRGIPSNRHPPRTRGTSVTDHDIHVCTVGDDWHWCTCEVDQDHDATEVEEE